MDAFAGAIGVSDSDGKSTPVYSVCQPLLGHEPRYAARVLRHIALSGYITSLGKGVRERSTEFRWTDAKDVLLPAPPLEEQRQIAEYLDRETGKIDELIAKQEQLVTTLTERRQAVISSAINRGLDTSAKFRPSRSLWWDELPTNWKIRRLKHLVAQPITDGPHETPDFLDEGVEFISAEAISGGTVNFEKRRGYISAADHFIYSQKYSPQLHDIYMIKSGATTGVSAILTVEREFDIWSPLAVIRANATMNPFFVHYAIRSAPFQRAVSQTWTFGTQQNIGMKSLGELPLPCPPLSEQVAIVEHLDEVVASLVELVKKTNEATTLLRERRAALISAAVTGKIDVRGL